MGQERALKGAREDPHLPMWASAGTRINKGFAPHLPLWCGRHGKEKCNGGERRETLNIENLWAVEYSNEQGCFHCATLGEIVKNNRFALARHESHGFYIIGICGTYEECGEVMNQWIKSGYAYHYSAVK